ACARGACSDTPAAQGCAAVPARAARGGATGRGRSGGAPGPERRAAEARAGSAARRWSSRRTALSWAPAEGRVGLICRGAGPGRREKSQGQRAERSPGARSETHTRIRAESHGSCTFAAVVRAAENRAMVPVLSAGRNVHSFPSLLPRGAKSGCLSSGEKSFRSRARLLARERRSPPARYLLRTERRRAPNRQSDRAGPERRRWKSRRKGDEVAAMNPESAGQSSA